MCRQGSCFGPAAGEEEKESEQTCPLRANQLVHEILNVPQDSSGLLTELGKACRTAKSQRIDGSLEHLALL